MIGVEIALRIVRAGCHPHFKLSDFALWQSFGLANDRANAFTSKAIIVLFAGFQACSVHFHGVVSAAVGLGRTFSHHFSELGVARDLPLDLKLLVCAVTGNDAGPKNDAIVQWVTTGNAVGEVNRVFCIDAKAAQGEQAECRAQSFDEGSAL